MKKGFTLMEMIVTMLLIGIVITVSIPAVRNLTYNSGSKKYNQMEKVIIEASKLYAASYQGELTNTSYECFNIPYSTLVKEELIEEEDITCSGQIILRKREKVGYNYEPYLTCTDSKGKVVHEEKRPSSLVNCIGFSGNFKVEYALYNDEGYSNNYTIGNWEKYVYGKYNSVSPYGSGIEKYQYTKDLLNWIDMTGDTEDYTNFNGTIYIRAIDQDGNKSSVAHHLIRTDTTGPSYALTNNEHQITNDNTMIVSISDVKDSGVGVEESGNIYSFDGGNTWVNSKSQEFALATTGEVQVKDKLANVTTQPLSVIKACSGNQGASATADKILTGYSAWVNGTLVNGSMANNGAISKTLNPGESYTIPAGYHNGSGKVTANSLASQTEATATADKILTGQTAWVNGSKITGTMANNGAISKTLNAGESYTIPVGFHNGSGKVTANSLASQTEATATAEDITEGKTAWVNGEKITGTSVQSTADSYYFRVYSAEADLDKNGNITITTSNKKELNISDISSGNHCNVTLYKKDGTSTNTGNISGQYSTFPVTLSLKDISKIDVYCSPQNGKGSGSISFTIS